MMDLPRVLGKFKVGDSKQLSQNSGIIFALFFLVIYLFTIPRTNVSYADSDFMITTGFFGGVAHPPGYPLYMLLMYFITHLPIPGSIAFRGNLLSALLHSGTLFFLYRSVWIVIDHLQQKAAVVILSKTTDKLIICVLSTASLGISFLFWTYSLVAEKYALNDLFAAIIIFLSLTLALNSRIVKQTRPWIQLTFVGGLALMHHQTIVLLAPMVIYLLISKRRIIQPIIWKMFLSFITAVFASIGLLLILNANNALVSWNFPPTVLGLYRELTRQDLTGQTMAGYERSMYLTGVSLDQMINKIPSIIRLYSDFFSLPILLIAVFGIYHNLKQNRRLAIPLTLLLFSTTFFIPLYIDWPINLADQSIKVRMHLLGHLSLPLFVGIGVHQLIGLLKQRFFRITVSSLMVILVGYRLVHIYPQVNLQPFDFTHRYYQHLLTNLSENSMLVCMSDVSCFALMYSHLVEHYRPDIILVPTVENTVISYLHKLPNLHGFDYPTEPDKTLDYLSWNLGSRPVAVVDMQKAYYEALGIDYGIVSYIPAGYYGLLSLYPVIPDQNDYLLSDELASIQVAPFDHMRQQVKAAVAQQHMLNARGIAQLEVGSLAVQQELGHARALVTDLPEQYQSAIASLGRQLQTQKGYILYDGKTASVSAVNLTKQADTYLSEQKYSLAFLGYRGSVLRDPRNPILHTQLANFYQQMGEADLAAIEFRNASRLTKNDL